MEKAKTVRFLDRENEVMHLGILLEDGRILCGCCGGTIEDDDIGTGDNCEHMITEHLPWTPISAFILGDDAENREQVQDLPKPQTGTFEQIRYHDWKNGGIVKGGIITDDLHVIDGETGEILDPLSCFVDGSIHVLEVYKDWKDLDKLLQKGARIW